MGYDVEFIQVPMPKGMAFPVKPETAKTLLAGALALEDRTAVRELMLKLSGMREGEKQSIDFLGKGMSYAKFRIGAKSIHVENNCSVKELLAIYAHVRERFPSLAIHDLQSGQLHDADSFLAWWAKPL